jgi:F-box interacting protein
MSLVDMCNGLICMCDSEKPGGHITLVNPVTGEALDIPQLPLPYAKATWYSYQMYGFAYHPTTGRYKVVYIPNSSNRVWVFTLGEASWREVEADGLDETFATYNIVSVNGTMYWDLNEPGAKVMSFDLDNEHITSIRPLPNVLSRPGHWYLTEVRGRLGIVFSHISPLLDKTEVWVMEHAMAGQRTWSRWYNVQMQKPEHLCLHHYLTQPNFTYDGEYILTTRWHPERGYVLYKHKPSNGGKGTRFAVEIDERNQGTEIAIKTSIVCRGTFSYVETTEPLSVYRCW